MKRKNQILIGISVVVLLLIGFFFFLFNNKKETETFQDKMEEINTQDWQQTGEFDEDEDEGISFELSLIEKCDAGEWIDVVEKNISDAKEFTGDVEIREESEVKDFFFEEGNRLFFKEEKFGNFFEDRRATVLALEVEGGLEVLKIKCSEGEVTLFEGSSVVVDEEIKDFEQSVMIELQKNSNALIKKQGDWEVVSFLWPNKEYVYVEFSALEKEEESFTLGESIDEDDIESFLLLLKVGMKNEKLEREEIGLLKMDDEDEWVAERGRDLFEDLDEGRLFEFDPDLGKWVKIN